MEEREEGGGGGGGGVGGRGGQKAVKKIQLFFAQNLAAVHQVPTRPLLCTKHVVSVFHVQYVYTQVHLHT